MLYETAANWLAAPNKRIMLFAMSGLGKTHISTMLRARGDWFHYSIDYRIGTRYMGEYIADNAKRHAMQVPFLRDLLMSDSIYIGSNIGFDNLTPVSTYLGKPGDTARCGLAIEEYTRRQKQFELAERRALLDTPYFIERANDLYGYPHFICDTGGSLCEWVDPDDPDDPILSALSEVCLPVWIKGSDAHMTELIRRFDRAPKPMAYRPDFLQTAWARYLDEQSISAGEVNPDDFIRWTYAQALAHRQPLYEAMAQNWGVTVTADQMASITTEADFNRIIAEAIDAKV